jgi:asparagine synthase (glutamine-hydrolysing)
MIEICSVINADTDLPVSEANIALSMASPVLSGLKNRQLFRRQNYFLCVAGNSPIEQLFLQDDRVTLICSADLLLPASSGQQGPAKTLAQSYLEKGDDFVKELHGTFSVILYDTGTRELKAWTDHFGVRRLVFADSARCTAVASDMRLVLPFLDREPEIDRSAILEYLLYSCIPAPNTIYTGIRKLEPGHYLTSGKKVTIRRYWDMNYGGVHRNRTVQEWASDTETAIRSAVAIHSKTALPSDRIGCFLSGGTDSSSVTGLVGQATGQAPRSFSIGFEDPRYNEIEYARTAANQFRCDHHEYFVTPQDIVDLFPKAAAAFDEPFGNSSVIPAYYCARLASEQNITHMLAGDGGDELFGGNSRYADDKVFQRYQLIPKWIRTTIIEPSLGLINSEGGAGTIYRASRYVRRSTIPLPDRWFSYSLLSSLQPEEIFSRDFLSIVGVSDPLKAARTHHKNAPAVDELNRWLYLDLKITITDNDVRKVTRMAELAGLSPRYPLLDHSLAEFSGTIPANLKVNGTQLRYIFKKAMSGILPESIIKKSKHGFGLPYCIWVGEYAPLREYTLDILRSNRCRQRGYFREDFAEWLWAKYESEHQRFYGEALWIFLMLELWHSHQHDAWRNR